MAAYLLHCTQELQVGLKNKGSTATYIFFVYLLLCIVYEGALGDTKPPKFLMEGVASTVFEDQKYKTRKQTEWRDDVTVWSFTLSPVAGYSDLWLNCMELPQ